ncbi:MAG TPA: hypothetical protein VEQ60_26705 [Longimicrobium sp.]|nr:hypothetical protein [Longimicrobium sp.]
MKKIRLNFEKLSVASFDVGPGSDVGTIDSFETNDRSCWSYCGPDNQHTGPTTPDAGC